MAQGQQRHLDPSGRVQALQRPSPDLLVGALAAHARLLQAHIEGWSLSSASYPWKSGRLHGLRSEFCLLDSSIIRSSG